MGFDPRGIVWCVVRWFWSSEDEDFHQGRSPKKNIWVLIIEKT